LVKAGPDVLPDVRRAVMSAKMPVQERLIRVLAWQGDHESLPLLQGLSPQDARESGLIHWAIQKIEVLSFKAVTVN